MMSNDTTRLALRRAARAAGRIERAVDRATAPGRNIGFPYRAPTVPRGVEVPAEPPSLGADYDTEWARSPPPASPAACSPRGRCASPCAVSPHRRSSAPTASTTSLAGPPTATSHRRR